MPKICLSLASDGRRKKIPIPLRKAICDQAILAVMIGTGLRRSEVRRIPDKSPALQAHSINNRMELQAVIAG